MTKEQILEICGKLSAPIKDLGLSKKVINSLNGEEIYNIYQLVLKTDDELMNMYGIGKYTMIHIKDRINKHIGEIDFLSEEATEKEAKE